MHGMTLSTCWVAHHGEKIETSGPNPQGCREHNRCSRLSSELEVPDGSHVAVQHVPQPQKMQLPFAPPPLVERKRPLCCGRPGLLALVFRF